MAKKQRGARANKPNDSFGTINNDSLYKGKYRNDVYKEDEEENLETAEVKKETPAEETETFVSTEKDQPHDYKKRYDDLKRHYDTKIKQILSPKPIYINLTTIYSDNDTEDMNLLLNQ